MGLPGRANTFHIKIYCSQCNTYLYKYRKEKKGSLVRCYVDKIMDDNTNGDLKCPQCGQEFARFKIDKTRPAHRIIQGKIFIKGHMKK